jgi:hypothetical protein
MEIFSSYKEVIPCGRTDRQADIMYVKKPTVTLRNCFLKRTKKDSDALIPKHILLLTIFLITKQELHYKFLKFQI